MYLLVENKTQGYGLDYEVSERKFAIKKAIELKKQFPKDDILIGLYNEDDTINSYILY